MLERALLYTAEVTVAALGRIWVRAARVRGFVAATHEVASRAYVEFVVDADETSDG